MSQNRHSGLSGAVIFILNRVEDTLLTLLLSAILLLAPLQIILRNFFDSGIVWVDPLLRVGVLWLGLVGAVVASRENRHISIDVVSKFLPPKVLERVSGLTALFTAAIAGLVAWNAGRFVADELEFGSIAFAGIEAWILESVIPVAFGLIALRYGASGIAQLFAPVRGAAVDETDPTQPEGKRP